MTCNDITEQRSKESKLNKTTRNCSRNTALELSTAKLDLIWCDKPPMSHSSLEVDPKLNTKKNLNTNRKQSGQSGQRLKVVTTMLSSE